MSAHAKNKYLFLFENPDVRRWYDNVSRGSRVTADVYLRRVGSFCGSLKTTPEKLSSLNDLELYNLMLDYVSSMEKAGYTGSYIESTLKSVKSWLSHNGKDIRRKIRIKGARESPSLKDERTPTKTELKRILLSGDKKSRATCIVVAHSGVRMEVLGNYDGKDGLTLGDLPDLKIENDSASFVKKPAILTVRRELSKAGHQYFSFLTTEACEYIEDYLNERIREGEQLLQKSPLITPKLRMKPFIRSTNVGDCIRESLRAAGFGWRPYILRCYFDTQLMLAESKGLVLRDYRGFWMGHKGDIENRYTTNKQRLPESVVEDMRAAYARSEEFLQTKMSEETTEEKLKGIFRRQFLSVAGFGKGEIEDMDVIGISEEEMQSLVRKKLLGVPTSDNFKQKVVTVDEANNYLSKGWEFVAKLSNNKVVVKISSESIKS